MLSSTLSFLCNPQPVVRPPPRGPYPRHHHHHLHHRSPPPVIPSSYSPPLACCGHCGGHSAPASPYGVAYHHHEHYHHEQQHGDEYGRRRQAAAVVVEQHHHHRHQHQHHYAAPGAPSAGVSPAKSAAVMVASEQELAYMDHMQRTLALLKESVKQLAVAPDDKRHQQQLSAAAAAAHATMVIEVAGSRLHDKLPVSALFKTIRKQRTQPRYHCCECGAANTTQWRNSPNGKKICNPCGMRLWRSRKRKESADAAAAEEDKKPEGEQQSSPQQPADDAQRSGRSNIYNLLN